jgi:hypothetical protein
MELHLVIGLILILIVGFFAFQWMSASSRRTTGSVSKKPVINGLSTGPGENLAPVAPVAPVEEKIPEVAGQTAQELMTPEPTQRPIPVVTQEAVTADGQAPADFQDTLRRPEQSFHRPQGNPMMTSAEVDSGRAGSVTTAVTNGGNPMMGQAMGFSPEMAQNGGAIVGGVFAYDGMEPTGFADFSAF